MVTLKKRHSVKAGIHVFSNPDISARFSTKHNDSSILVLEQVVHGDSPPTPEWGQSIGAYICKMLRATTILRVSILMAHWVLARHHMNYTNIHLCVRARISLLT